MSSSGSYYSRSFKKKSRAKSGQSRKSNAGERRRKDLIRPEWNSTGMDNPFGMSPTELEHRRQQRISKNLAQAQIELYDRMPWHGKSFGSSVPGSAFGPQSRLTKESLSHHGNLDLQELLFRSEELLKESQELLRADIPERKVSQVHFARAKRSDEETSVSECRGSLTSDGKRIVQFQHIHLPDQSDESFISSIPDTNTRSVTNFDRLSPAERRLKDIHPLTSSSSGDDEWSDAE